LAADNWGLLILDSIWASEQLWGDDEMKEVNRLPADISDHPNHRSILLSWWLEPWDILDLASRGNNSNTPDLMSLDNTSAVELLVVSELHAWQVDRLDLVIQDSILVLEWFGVSVGSGYPLSLDSN